MNESKTYLLSTIVHPVTLEPLSPGVVIVQGDRIKAVGDSKLLKKITKEDQLIELENTLLLPGFVNAHCHLELTHLGPISTLNLESESEPEDKIKTSFVRWIINLVEAKNRSHETQVVQGIHQGIKELLHSGVTAIGDHISFNTPCEILVESPLKGRLFGEVLGVIPEVARDILATFKSIKKELASKTNRWELNISPHAVHSLDPEILKEVLLTQQAPLSCHLAESKAEYEYFDEHSGDFSRLIKNRGIQPQHHQVRSGLDYLKQQNLPLEKLLLIHGNYLNDEEINWVQEKNISVVHCPRSRAYFGHKEFPYEKLKRAGINIALGTDSLSSNQDLNFFDEIRRAQKSLKLDWSETLSIATINGAKALRMDDEIGSIEVGKKADLIGVHLQNNSWELSLDQAHQVDFMMIEGKKII